MLLAFLTLTGCFEYEEDHDEHSEFDHDGDGGYSGDLEGIGCEQVQALPDSGTIQAIGDSMFDFLGGCQDAPDLVGVALGERVTNNAVGGATMLEDIPGQYDAGGWDWVIVDGGGNDLEECDDEESCMALIDAVEDTTRELLNEIRSDGAKVALVGYPEFAEHELWQALGGTMMSRMSSLADDIDGVYFVDLRPVMDGGSSPGLFDGDMIHPSESGAAVMAESIAGVISANN